MAFSCIELCLNIWLTDLCLYILQAKGNVWTYVWNCVPVFKYAKLNRREFWWIAKFFKSSEIWSGNLKATRYPFLKCVCRICDKDYHYNYRKQATCDCAIPFAMALHIETERYSVAIKSTEKILQLELIRKENN
jgi:hypothetical protein